MPTVSLQHNTKAVRAGSKNVALAVWGREDPHAAAPGVQGRGAAGGGKDSGCAPPCFTHAMRH